MDAMPSHGELGRIRAEVTELVKGRFVQIGPRGGILVIRLRADQAELARQVEPPRTRPGPARKPSTESAKWGTSNTNEARYILAWRVGGAITRAPARAYGTTRHHG